MRSRCGRIGIEVAFDWKSSLPRSQAYSFASLLGDLRHGRHQLLRAWPRKHVSPTLRNFREAPADDPLSVQKELTDQLSVSRCNHLLVGFGQFILVLLVEDLAGRHRIHGAG